MKLRMKSGLLLTLHPSSPGFNAVMRIADIVGRALHFLNLPGFVQECDYWAKGSDVHVTVRKSHLYTTITVNGIDIYFDRATGRIDGTGLSATSGSRSVLRPQSVRLGEQHALQRDEVQS